MSHRKPRPFGDCAHCSQSFQFPRWWNPGHPVPVYCSASCRSGGLSTRQAGRPVARVRARCPQCCYGFDRMVGSRHVYCSKDCRAMAVLGYRATATAWLLIVCARCPRFVDQSTKRTPPCCSHCVPRMPGARKDRTRIKNARRRAIVRPGHYAIVAVAAKTSGRCHICRKRVDLRLSGMDPLGPTIDHLLPISAGGLDEFANVMLAHRVCNTRRGTGGVVQLSMI